MHLSPAQRLEIIAIYNDLNDLAVKSKCKRVAEIALGKGIEISSTGVRFIVKKYSSTGIFVN